MQFSKNSLLLYAITDRTWVGPQTLLEQIEDALRGGVTLVQLREKQLDEAAFTEEARLVLELCHKYGVPLIINDNLAVARAVGADGIHVGADDLSVAEIRAQMPSDFIIGATAKTPAQARAAEKAGASYLGVGAVFQSPTKQTALRITKEQLNEICSSVAIPSVAIGGIELDNVEELTGSPIAGIAVVSAVFGAPNIQEAARALRKKLSAVVQP